MSIEVKNTIEVLEVNGTKPTAKSVTGELPKIRIREHYFSSRIVLEQIDGTLVTLMAGDLQKAIWNACNK